MSRLEFLMPDVGEGLADVEVVKWLVAVGDAVTENEPVAEVETDKAIVTMPAPGTGRIAELSVREGERVKVGARLLVLETGDGAKPVLPSPEESQARRAPSVQRAASSPSAPTAVQASPVARKLAAERGIDLARVVGTGPGGRITVEDVERLATPAKGATDAVERVPLRGLRRRIAEAMTQSVRAIPHVTGFYEIEASSLVALRDRLRPSAEAKGVHLTYLPFLVKATVVGLKAHPYLNASLDEAAEAILIKKSYNVGIATATEDGLMVPVLHRAGELGLLEIAREAERLATAARERRVKPEELKDGTFTITNVGQMGGFFGTSIIRYPEAGILGIGRIEDRAVVREGKIVVRPILPLSLSFDHRIVDGDVALGFIQTLRHLVGNAEELIATESPWW